MHNTRDLGGYTAKDGQITQYRRLFRTDMPWRLSDRDAAYLRELGLSYCIDLRSPSERDMYPHYFEDDPSVDVKHVYLMQGMQNESNPSVELKTLGELYIYMADNVKEKINEVFNAIAEAPEGIVMFNCTAGKDRTGVIAALLLAACGAEYYDIVADYMVSEIYNRPITEHIRTVSPEISLTYHKSEPHNIEALFEHIGGTECINDYLYSCGISRKTLTGVADRLLIK